MSDAVTSSETPAPYPATASARPSRALGVAALLIALVPLSVIVISLLATLVILPAIPGGGSVDGISWLLLAGSFLIYAGPVLALAGLVLGIVAVRKKRGRGAGIAAIVIGGFTLAYGLLTLISQLLIFLTYSSSF